MGIRKTIEQQITNIPVICIYCGKSGPFKFKELNMNTFRWVCERCDNPQNTPILWPPFYAG